MLPGPGGNAEGVAAFSTTTSLFVVSRQGGGAESGAGGQREQMIHAVVRSSEDRGERWPEHCSERGRGRPPHCFSRCDEFAACLNPKVGKLTVD